jgi:hypothetical protein
VTQKIIQLVNVLHPDARTDWKRQRERVTVEHRTAVEDRLIVMEHDVAVSASFRRERNAHLTVSVVGWSSMEI